MRLFFSILLFTTIPAFSQHPLMSEYNRAWINLGQLRANEAIRQLQEILAKDPTFWRAYKLLAKAFVAGNRSAEGEQYFLSLQHPFANCGLGYLYQEKGDWRGADRAFRMCITDEPQAYPFYYAFTQSLSALRRNSEAIQHFQSRVALDPQDPRGHFGLALAEGHRQRWKEAIAAGKRALQLARSQSNEDLEVVALRSIVGFCALSRICAESVEPQILKMKQMFRAQCDLEEVLSSELQLAGAIAATGDYRRAQVIYGGVLISYRALRHSTGELEALRALTQLERDWGRPEIALRYLRQSNSLIPDGSKQMLGYHKQSGELAMQLGSYAEAIAHFNRYRQAAAHHALRSDEGFAQRAMGQAYRALGDYTRALFYTLEAQKIFRQTSPEIVVATTNGNLGVLYQALGDYQKAREGFREALRSARTHGDLSVEEQTLDNLGRLEMETGRWKEAESYFRQSLALAERVGRVAYKAGTLASLGELQRRRGQHTEAYQSLSEALALSRKLRYQYLEGTALSALGALSLQMGDVRGAAGHFGNALVISEATGLHELVWTAHKGLAEVHDRLDDFPQALNHYRKAIEGIESIRGRLPLPELRTGFLHDKGFVYEAVIRLLARRHAQEPHKGFDRLAFKFAERARARSFLETLAERQSGLALGLTPEQARQEAAKVAAITRANLALRREDSERNRKALKQAEDALSTWTLETRTANPNYFTQQSVQPAEVEEVQRVLASRQSALVQFALGADESFAWVLTPAKLHLIRLPGRASFEPQILEIHKLLSQRPSKQSNAQQFQNASRFLYRTLIGPVEEHLGIARTVIVVPDGLLHYLPFEALTDNESRPWLNRRAVTYAPSASVMTLADHASRPAPATRLDLLAFGDPVTPRRTGGALTAEEIVRSSYLQRGLPLDPLPHSRIEVEAIGRLFPLAKRRIYLGSEATEESLSRENPEIFRILHFASHAMIDEQFPSRSGILLSVGRSGVADGILQLHEIAGLKLNADLVVLSACRTGLGTLVRGEGMVGLTRTFMLAGASRLVVSLWDVNDIGTAEFMKLFYGNLRTGMSPADALRKTKLAMANSEITAYRHPYFWAPFILAGNP